jgi:hypothetical protein
MSEIIAVRFQTLYLTTYTTIDLRILLYLLPIEHIFAEVAG